MQKYVYKGGVGWWSRGWYTWAFEKRTFNVDGLGGIVDVARAIAMSRWPPEIAGTISHPAGRSAVTAERVPIFYSARSSSPSFHPHALSLSLSLSSFSLSNPSLLLFYNAVCTRVSVCWSDTTSRREWTGAVSTPKKKDERGGRRWPEARKKADAPTTPDLSTLPSILSFFFSFRPRPPVS